MNSQYSPLTRDCSIKRSILRNRHSAPGHLSLNELESAYKMSNIAITKEEFQLIVKREGNDTNRIDYAHFLVASVDHKKLEANR